MCSTCDPRAAHFRIVKSMASRAEPAPEQWSQSPEGAGADWSIPNLVSSCLWWSAKLKGKAQKAPAPTLSLPFTFCAPPWLQRCSSKLPLALQLQILQCKMKLLQSQSRSTLPKNPDGLSGYPQMSIMEPQLSLDHDQCIVIRLGQSSLDLHTSIPGLSILLDHDVYCYQARTISSIRQEQTFGPFQSQQ